MYKNLCRILMILAIISTVLIYGGCSIRGESTPVPATTTEKVQASPSDTASLSANNTLPVALRGKVIHIVDDDAEWPPYTFYERIDGKVSDKLVGYSVDVIKEIFDKSGIPYTIELLPWKRAQADVERGNNYQMLLSATRNSEREQKYYISEGYYTTAAYYFYSKKYHPNGLSIKEKADLEKFKVAGLLGHNYSSYGLDNDEIYMGAKSYESLVQQLHAGRYDIFLESLEILSGYSKINIDILKDRDLGYAKVPGMQPVEFHMMFTQDETGAALKKIVDAGIEEMKNNGKLDELLKKYIP